jgi:integral membrane sensor domain MASE1
MRNPNTAMNGLENGVYAWFGPGALVASAVGLAFVVALWFTTMLFLVRGFVDAASSGPVTTAEAGYETVVQ